MESLLYVAVALATTAKIYHTKRDTLQTAKELFSVPLMYDPRFQRSPFDALGRSMRLGGQHAIPTHSITKTPYYYDTLLLT